MVERSMKVNDFVVGDEYFDLNYLFRSYHFHLTIAFILCLESMSPMCGRIGFWRREEVKN